MAGLSNSIMVPSATLTTTVCSLTLWTMPWMPAEVTTLSPVCRAAMRAGLFLALALLRADQQEIEHDDHQAHHQEGAAEQAAGALGCGLGLGEEDENRCHVFSFWV